MTTKSSKGGRQQFWMKHVEAARRSGQTLIRYARVHGLPVGSLYNATSRSKRANRGEVVAGSAFVPVTIEASALAPVRCRLQHAAGWQLEFEHLPDARWLRELLNGEPSDAAP